MHKLHLTGTLHELNQKKLEHPKLVQLFDRFATYNGSSPYLTPGVMSSIPHLEHNVGTFYPKGGMRQIVSALYNLAVDLGVEFKFSSPVERIVIKQKRAVGVEQGGDFYSADIVISNMDVVPTYRKLLKDARAPEKVLKQERSSSALIFYWGIKKQFKELDLHNIFFSNN
jgi:phytoene dehydrogenase-like protein